MKRRYSARRVREAWTNDAPTWEVIDCQHPDRQPAWFTDPAAAIRYRDEMEADVKGETLYSNDETGDRFAATGKHGGAT